MFKLFNRKKQNVRKDEIALMDHLAEQEWLEQEELRIEKEMKWNFMNPASSRRLYRTDGDNNEHDC